MAPAVLHCYADFKWTGPSEPIVLLCRELTRRGWRADLACMARGRWRELSVGERARGMGLRVFDDFTFGSGFSPARNFSDIQRLRRLVDGGDYALVHCHGTWDHMIASVALRGRRGDIPVIRTDHGERRYRRNYFWRRYFGPPTIDRLVVLSDRHRTRVVESLKLPPEFVSVVRGAVDTSAFSPQQPAADLRGELGLGKGDVLLGVVARVQRHRRFDVLLEAARIVQARAPAVKIAVCGRGTHRRSILEEPVASTGLGRTVFPLGYRVWDYAATLAGFDGGVMLVPGSDGSCRAALQMAAMGKALIVAERGVLPDIVVDGVTGIVVKDTPADLAEAMITLAVDESGRARMGEAARCRMCELFSLERAAEEVIGLYGQVLGERAARTGSGAGLSRPERQEEELAR
jgi:glycosyltransferase involved in cell wall biosynthesis